MAEEPAFGIFVMSSDNTADVAKHFAAAFSKNVENLDATIFWGTNSTAPALDRFNVELVRAERSGWKNEVLAQLDEIKRRSPRTSHLVVFLDDFIVTGRLDFRPISHTLTEAIESGVKYLRLGRLEESVWVRLLWRPRPRKVFGGKACIGIRTSHPYYSSLQVAMWEIDYLIDTVRGARNIWDFETKRGDAEHYAVAEPAVRYRHAVEKGAWDYGAGELCRKNAGFFEPGARRRRSGRLGAVLHRLRRAQFALTGYGPARLRKFILAK